MITTKAFWAGAAERAIKTFLQTFVATLGVVLTGIVTPEAFSSAPWATSAITAGLAALLSLATSVGNASFTAGGEPARRALEE